MNTIGAVLIVVVVLAVMIGLVVINVRKGKSGMAVIGLFVYVVWIVGAVRLAKPDSRWARRYYVGNEADKMRRAEERFGVPGHREPMPVAPVETAPLCSGSRRRPHPPVKCTPVADPDDPTYRCSTCGREQRLSVASV